MPSPGVTATWGADHSAAYVLDHLSSASVLLNSGARRINIAGKQAHVPRLNSDGTATWTAENAEIASSAPDADEILLIPKKLANVVTLSTESVLDAEVDSLDRVGDAMTRSVAVGLDTAVFDAVAVSATRPAGLRNAAAYTLPGATADPTDLDVLLSGIGAIRTAGGRANAIYMAAADITTISLKKKLTTGSNEPLLTRNADGHYEVGGAELWPTPGMPAGTALVAQADQIVVGVRRDASVEISKHAKFTADSVVARVIGRFDWEPNDTDGLYLIA